MEKGLEITFTISDKDEREIVEAMANIVGNEFLMEFDIEWRVFHVEKAEDRFYKVCFTGRKLSRLHPMIEGKVKERFDNLSHLSKKELLNEYDRKRRNSDFRREYVRDIREEYDLWNDNFWQYF